MGKAARNREHARARIAEQQVAARRAEQRRRLLLVGGSALVVVAIVVAIIAGGVFRSSPKQACPSGGSLPQAVARDVTNVPPGTLSRVGTGPLPAATALPLRTISDSAEASGAGKPQFLYIGAEWCPYCAAMRWPMTVALSRFGTFGPLKGIHSASTDVFPNTATLTFYQQKYASNYLTFTPVENQDVAQNQLQATTKSQQAAWVKYDSQNGSTSFPFLYFGGKVIMTGPLYDPGVLKGLTWSQIAQQLANPRSAVARNVNGAANYITASICKMTSNTPSSVCSAAPIPNLESKL